MSTTSADVDVFFSMPSSPSTPGLQLNELVTLDADAANAFDTASDLAAHDASIDVTDSISDDVPLFVTPSNITDDDSSAPTTLFLQINPHRMSAIDVVDDNTDVNNDNPEENSIYTYNNSKKQVLLLLLIK